MILILAVVENWKSSRSPCHWGMSSKALEAFLQNVVKDSSRQIIPSLTTIIQKLANITYDCNFLFWFSFMFWKIVRERILFCQQCVRRILKNCESKKRFCQLCGLKLTNQPSVEIFWEQKKILSVVWPNLNQSSQQKGSKVI